MYECYANANLKKKKFWLQEIERINIRIMLDKLTKTESFASKTF